MQLVQIDVVGLQAPQAVLERPVDVVGPGPFAFGVDLHAELRGQDDLGSACPQGAAEKLLALRASVDVGGVEEGDAGVDGTVHHRRGAVVVEPAAEVVAAQSDDRYLERADRASAHGHPSLLGTVFERAAPAITAWSPGHRRTLMDWLAVARRVPSSAHRWARPCAKPWARA